MTKATLTAARLHELLHYEPETGAFTGIAARGTRKAGHKAGSQHSDGYIYIQVAMKKYKAHRLAWLYMTGEWPVDHIDHINCIRFDNRWANLRDVTNAVNQQNRLNANISNMSTGLLGVSLTKVSRSNPFQSQIKINGKQRHLGLFKTAELAHAAYVQAKRQHHSGGML